jgi:hypothetical protein
LQISTPALIDLVNISTIFKDENKEILFEKPRIEEVIEETTEGKTHLKSNASPDNKVLAAKKILEGKFLLFYHFLYLFILFYPH